MNFNRNGGRAIVLSCCLVLMMSVPPTYAADDGQFYRLFEGITAYVDNPEGKDFTIGLDVRDLNLVANGPREVLFKVYDPDGKPVVREIIPDDGCVSPNFPERIAGWDQELQYYANLYEKGTAPSYRWSAWSDPNRLKTIVARNFDRLIKGGKKGLYRIVLAGTSDHYVTLRLSPNLHYGVAGHPTFMHAHGDMLAKSFIYVPPGTNGIFFAVTEPDMPRTRHFKLTAPDGAVLFDGVATGGYTSPGEKDWKDRTVGFSKPGVYDGKLLTLEVSPGNNDYLIKITLQHKKEPWADYVGMGSLAVFAPDPETANALRGGTTVIDGEVFWHPFQIRFVQWLNANKLDATPEQKALRKELEAECNGMRMLETSDGRGSATWVNWAYGMGYYGCKIFRPGWLLMQRTDLPPDVREIIREGLIMAGDRLGFATGIEKVNGNAFTQINVALWYSQRATGDAMQKQRFETFWQRWTSEGWGAGCGLSRSGDSQEHFAHDAHYGSYVLDNWKATTGTWVKEGILGDAKDDPRFQQVIDRYQELYSYLFCREKSGMAVAANPWSSRTHAAPHHDAANWENAAHPWKGDPGPDLTVDVNGGHEWFAARRHGYYMLTFHGRLAPAWMSECFQGQLGFGGGAICQLTIPGRGPVLASTLKGSYGEGMHVSNWPNFHIHSLVGQTWDGRPLIAGISEHDNARLEGSVVSSSGEIREAHLKVARSYTYEPDAIECSVKLAESDYAQLLSIWSHERVWSDVKSAYEMIPFLPAAPGGKKLTSVILFDKTGKEIGPMTAEAVEAQRIRIDRGGFGVEIQLEKPLKVRRGATDTVMIEIIEAGAKAVPASRVELKYRLVPFGA
jgi:hypothetical protein